MRKLDDKETGLLWIIPEEIDKSGFSINNRAWDNPIYIPEDKKMIKEFAKELNQFLEKLAETERRVFICRYWYMDSNQTLAKTFSLSENVIRQRLFRAREKLKEFLEKEGIGL